MYNIFIVDDHEILRDGIRALLLGTKIRVLADFSNPFDLFERLKTQQPDLILLDIIMPKMSGLEALNQLKKDYPDIPILMFSAETEDQRIQQAVQRGALGFLPKDCTQAELIQAIETVVKNQHYFGNSILSTVFKGYADSTKPTIRPTLSEREISIIQFLCEGMSYKQIAKKLFISPRTVESHKQGIFKKLTLNNNAQLIKYAIKNGLTNLD